MSTYLEILILSISLPLLFSFHPKIKFYKKWKYFFTANLSIAIPFIIWDYLFTKQGVWKFSDHHISGIKIINLPIEEILFFILIPYCFIFTYEVLGKYISIKKERNELIKRITFIAGIFILILGITTLSYIYTSTTLIFLSFTLIIISKINIYFLDAFYITFLIITCIPFVIVNGMLTGIMEESINTAVVVYNDQERFFNRFLTIPIEDFFYSMLLLISNTLIYEIIQKRKC